MEDFKKVIGKKLNFGFAKTKMTPNHLMFEPRFGNEIFGTIRTENNIKGTLFGSLKAIVNSKGGEYSFKQECTGIAVGIKVDKLGKNGEKNIVKTIRFKGNDGFFMNLLKSIFGMYSISLKFNDGQEFIYHQGFSNITYIVTQV